MSADSRGAGGPRSGSAFTRLAGIVPSVLSGSSTSSDSHVSASSVGSLPAPPASGRALDALEALSSVDGARSRYSPTIDGADTTAAQRRADKSRSRDRNDSPALIVQSRMIGAGRDTIHNNSNSSGYWTGGDTSSNVNSSAFSLFQENASHFFPAGASAFSFEGGASSGAYDGSWRATSSSPSLFGSSRFPASVEPTSSFPGPSSWELQSVSAVRHRGESPMGGGRKLKDQSRGLRYAISAAARDRGLVGLAKPRDGGTGRVAVAGRTSLKILNVPTGQGRRGRDTPNTSSHRSSSIAYRRSQSRSAAASSEDGSEHQAAREEVTESLDVRAGSKLGPSYLFSDVQWGYDATSNKLATSFTNGAVSLWDLGSGSSRVTHQVKYEHDRAVNRVCFGGASGSWLVSGGQDGQMKLWDIRETRSASLVLKASSPVRHLAFSPSNAQPFTLLAACASGTLIRYDLRYTSKQGGGATDRIAGHIGSCLAMDWRDALDGERMDTAGGAREGGWLVTGGLDKTIKVWDMSLTTLSTKPLRTLYTSQPVQAVAWHPTRSTELSSSPLPTLTADGPEDAPPPTPTRAMPIGVSTRDGAGAPGASWKNEIEVWDVRRPALPKLGIKTEEPISAIIYNDDETIWATSKSSPSFYQYDLASDSYSLLDSIERASAVWNHEGDMVFVEEPRNRRKPFETHTPTRNAENSGVEMPIVQPETLVNALSSFDPDFSPQTFAYLANNLQVVGTSFAEICDINAEVYACCGRPDATQFWYSLKIWLDDQPFFPATPPLTPPDSIDPPRLQEDPRPPIAVRLADILPAAPSRPVDKYLLRSPRVLPADAKTTLSDFSEEPSASEPEQDPTPPLSTGYSYYPELSSSSDSETEQPPAAALRPRQLSSSASRLSSSIAGLRATSRRPSRGSSNGRDMDLRPPADERSTEAGLSRGSSVSRRQSIHPSSESGSDSGDDAGEKVQRARAAKIQALHGHLVSTRRGGSLSSDHRRPDLSRDSAKASRQASIDGTLAARRGSAAGISFSRLRAATEVPTDPARAAEHKRQAGQRLAAEARQAVQEQLKVILQDYADQGDSQLCATVCCVLQNKDLALPSLFVTRVTKAYIDLLRKADQHVAAAMINRSCAPERLRALTENNVVHHAACGRCGKAIEQPPFGFCTRCSSQATRCCVCHLTVRGMFMWCAACGHGAHAACIAILAHGGGTDSGPSSFTGASPNVDVSHSHSHPSTPGIGTPMRNWMWGEGEDGEEGNDSFGAQSRSGTDRSQSKRPLSNGCPAGLCGHSPCLLNSAYE